MGRDQSHSMAMPGVAHQATTFRIRVARDTVKKISRYREKYRYCATPPV
jgi:hypothetical protein